jgi:hypothetical protein
MTRLVVERVHRVSRRPWIFLTGRLEGEALRIGDEVTVMYGEAAAVSTIIRSIELHSLPGKTTVAVDVELADSLGEGAVITRA